MARTDLDNMELPILAGIVIFLVSVVLSQRVVMRATDRLDDETRLQIAKIFSRRNANYTIMVFGLIIAFLFGLYALPQHRFILIILYCMGFLAYIFLKLFLNVRKLREISAPEFYVRCVIMSFAIFIGGAIAAGIVMVIGNIGIAD